MIIDCISDLHGHYPKLEGGDLLIVAGDLTAGDDFQGWLYFVAWLQMAKYKKKIVIGGNHDHWFVKNPPKENTFGDDCSYLCDSGTEFMGRRIYGSPWTKSFPGMNAKRKAFTVDTEEELAAKWALIPDDIDILVTHSPPKGIMDEVTDYPFGKYLNCGSLLLLSRARSLLNLKLFVFGHIHEGYGILTPEGMQMTADQCPERPPTCKTMPYIVNASHVDERYQPVNKPIRLEL